jgi:hypothetical protein
MFVAYQQATPIATQPGPHHPPTAVERHALRSAASLTLIACTIILLIGAAALILISRHRRRVMADPTLRRRKKRKPLPDPWSESGKRLDPNAAGARDDTVDIDPEELGPGDVRGDGPDRFDPHGDRPPNPLGPPNQ